jgi:hypothetical protein
MGTPHQGGSGVHLGKLMINIASVVVAADNRLLKHLERDSEWLQQQLGQYGPISGDFVTKFAFEEYPTPTVLGQSIMVRIHAPWFAAVFDKFRLYHEPLLWSQEQPMRSQSQYMRITSTWSSLIQRRIMDTELYRGTYRSWREKHATPSAHAGTRRLGVTRVCSFNLRNGSG